MLKEIKKTIKFSQRDIENIEQCCKKKGITFSHFIRIAVGKYLDEVI